jgi:hypothetical protein
MCTDAAAADRPTGDRWVNKYVDEMKMQVRKADENFGFICFSTDLKVIWCFVYENTNKCLLNL